VKPQPMGENRWLNVTAITLLPFVIATMLAPGLVSAAGNKALDILRNAVLARGEVTYSAVATVDRIEKGQPKSNTQLIFREKGGRERIKLQGADGQTVWLRVSDGEAVWEHHVAWAKVFRRTEPDAARIRARELYNLQVLGSNFQVALLGTETIAGRQAYHIRIGDPGPPEKIIRDVWIDQSNYVELKTQEFGPDNHAVHTVALERVNFHPTFEPGTFTFEPPENVKVQVIDPPKYVGSVNSAARQAGLTAMLPQQLPPGFSLFPNLATVRELHGVTVLWFQYTNGVRTFSIFERKVQPDAKAPGPGRGGVRTIRVGDYHFTVVGPLSPQEFETIKAGYESQNP
jgi:outer membrane lipoprotein-sorting protein